MKYFALATLFMSTTAFAVEANRVAELMFFSKNAHADPFNQVELDVVFTSPAGREMRVPAFWFDGPHWAVRYSSAEVGVHRFRTVCSDASDAGLHDIKGDVEVTPYGGDNALYKHGPMRVAADKKHFAHADGTPFFWLADTWWMGLTNRLQWPGEFATLTRDRVDKGFTVVQIVAGLYPDMPAFDPRGANDSGFPWEKQYARINSGYFDDADMRIKHLADSGLAPCVVGAWGYHLPWLGVERMKKHWRYMIARWGAYPVFWCVAGEAAMPYYMLPAEEKPKAAEFQKQGWTEITKYIREIDPFDRPITIHPTDMSRRQVTDASLLDFEFLQTGHGDRAVLGNTISLLKQSRAATPTMPTINSEVCYEGIIGTCSAEVVRLMTWTSLLAGTAGHTYGANGIWQLNRRDRPYGKSPHGGDYGHTPWDEAMNLPGSKQSALAKKLLEKFEWWKFERHEDWAEYHAAVDAKVAWGDWIWHAADGDAATDAPIARRVFRFHFKVPDDTQIDSAVIHLTADDRFSVKVNDAPVGKSDDSPASWRRPVQFNVTDHVGQGGNVIEVEAENVKSDVTKNPAGLLCGGEVKLADGTTISLASSEQWVSREGQDAFWPRVNVVAKYGQGPWGNFETNQRTPIAAAGIEGKVRVIYVPDALAVRVKGLENDGQWRATYFDPVEGRESDIGALKINEGASVLSPPAGAGDWVIVFQRP